MIIDSNYKIESDELNVTLLKKRIGKEGKAEGREIWEPISYHPSLKYALKDYVLKEINNTNMESLQALAEKIEEINRKIDNLDI